MSILIKGMDMPENCNKCIISGCEHSLLYLGIADKRSINCPLIPVLLHGNLIDRDKYRDEFMNGVYTLCSDDSDNSRANAIIDLFDYAPTFILAEENK